MDDEMNVGELLVEKAEENQTRKILEILKECKDLTEAQEKVKALLNSYAEPSPETSAGRYLPPSRFGYAQHTTPQAKRQEERTI